MSGSEAEKTIEKAKQDAQSYGVILDCFPQFYGGLEREIRATANGNVFVTFRRKNDNVESYSEANPERAVVFLQGGRNPPTGEAYQIIKPMLETGEIDSFTVLYPPMSTNRGQLVYDPDKMAADLRTLRSDKTISEHAKITISGVSLGADIAAYAVKNGLNQDVGIDGLLLFEPVTFTKESRQEAEKMNKKWIDRVFNAAGAVRLVKMLTESAPLDVVLQALTGLMVLPGVHLARFLQQRYQNVDVSSKVFIKLDFPQNIRHILITAGKSIAILGAALDEGIMQGEKIPKVHIYWSKKELAGITEEVQKQVNEKAAQLGIYTKVGEVDGSHGEMRGVHNKTSYMNAINTCVNS